MSRGIKVSSKRLRRERKVRAWSQAKLAQKAEVSLGTVARIEQGHAATPDVIGKLADALGVDPSLLTAPTEDTGDALLALVEGKARELREAMGTGEVSVETVLRAEWLLKDLERYAGPMIGDGRTAQATQGLWSEIVEAWKVAAHVSAGLEKAPVKNILVKAQRKGDQRGEVKSA